MSTPFESHVFTIPEHRLRHRLGLCREDLRALRLACLEKGKDWIDHGRILLSEVGAQKLAEKISSKKLVPKSSISEGDHADGHLEAERKKNVPLMGTLLQPEPLEFTITRCGFANWRMVAGVSEKTPETMIRTNAQSSESARHWRPGMKLMARWEDDHWHQVGRAPRYPGRY